MKREATQLRRSRIAFIGAGHVGSTAAYAMMLRALVEEIVLVDRNDDLAKAEAADLADANALARPARIWAGSYEDAASAQIAVFTAGAASRGDESRLDLAARSAVIVAECVRALAQAGFAGVLVIASNPVDLMTLVAMRNSGLPISSVIGTGTLLDSSRLGQALAAEFDVAPGAIEALVIGEHGDSEVAAFSNVRIGGQRLEVFSGSQNGADIEALSASVRSAAYRIVGGKGYTSFGIATAIVRICEAIIRDERTVLPVSTWMTGAYGIKDICLSLPCILSARGVERVLVPDLLEPERAALIKSALVLQKALATLDRVH